MADDSTAAAPGPFAGIARALRHRNYRLFFAGQAVSLLGTWMQQVAFAWLVYRQTRDDFILGLVTFAGQAPSVVLVPLAGVLLDRLDRRRLVLTTQALAMGQAVVLAVLTFTGLLPIWLLVLLAVFLGCVNAFDLPARQSFLPALLADRIDLGNAIALNSSLFNAARFVGPTLAGLIVGLLPDGDGEGLCFVLNALSYLAVLLALARIDLPAHLPPPPAPLLHGLAEGVRYAFASPPIRVILPMVAWMGFVGMPYTVLLPRIADQVLGGGSETYGFLMTASGMGALLGAIFLASRQGIEGAGLRIVFTATLVGGSLVGLAQARALWLALALLVLVGFGMMLTVVSCNTVVQTLVEDDKRGRVMSLYTLAFLGMTPPGSLLVGALSRQLDPTLTMTLCGVGCLLGAALFAVAFPHRQLANGGAAAASADPPTV
jgi:MFS family permease